MSEELNIPHRICTIIVAAMAAGFYVQFGIAIANKAQDPRGWLLLGIVFSFLSIFNLREIFKS